MLDTCAAIWLMADEALSATAVDAIDQASDMRQAIYVSPFTAWEVGLLVARGRLPLAVTPLTWFNALTSQDLVELADLTPEILIASSSLPGTPPNDPADRIIIATARQQGMMVMTRDRLILGYADAGHVGAIAC
ncbi:hypothetical protein ABAC460_04150 [Asticcacaulis sp. AC460]|nr:hypothetical protein ABAC460_04150 [Asticcacaulis sp. AC460]